MSLYGLDLPNDPLTKPVSLSLLYSVIKMVEFDSSRQRYIRPRKSNPSVGKKPVFIERI